MEQCSSSTPDNFDSAPASTGIDVPNIDKLVTFNAPVTVGGSFYAIDPKTRVHDTHLSGILSHEEAVASLSGLRKNLRSECLPFIAPPETSSSHPSQLFVQLSNNANQRAILLLGPAGAGKTRTCFEVGDLALAEGWTVLHVQPGEPPVTLEQLSKVLADCPTEHALVLVDYLNECRGIDAHGIRSRLLPRASTDKKRVAILASARPGWFSQVGAAATRPLFDTVTLSQDAEHYDRISTQIISSVAPVATSRFGQDFVLDACGGRPVIALLIAREIDSRAKRGDSRQDILTGIRKGHLLYWLERRLAEDGLTPEPASTPIADEEPSQWLLTCAAMSAACPQAMTGVAASGALIGETSAQDARYLLSVLLNMGWIVESNKGLSIVHDIVTDQLLERTLLRRGSHLVRIDAASKFLDGALHSGRTINRYASNLARLSRDLRLDSRDKELHSFAASWFVLHSSEIGARLAEKESEGAFGLAAILDNPAWLSPAIETWDVAVRPWLALHGESEDAGFFLYRALYGVKENQSQELIRVALSWLDRHFTELSATFVLQPLLRRTDLTPTTVSRVVEVALVWLDEYGDQAEARYVLSSLLRRDDLGVEAVIDSVGVGVKWLEQHNVLAEADFVLNSLLNRRDLAQAAQAFVLEASMDWIRRHWDITQAEYIYSRLLIHFMRGDSNHSECLDYAIRWLRMHALALSAHHVLCAVLDSFGAPAALPLDVCVVAFKWLEKNGCSQEVHGVLRRLIKSGDLLGLRIVLWWAVKNPTRDDLAQHLLALSRSSDFADLEETVLVASELFIFTGASNCCPGSIQSDNVDRLLGVFAQTYRAGIAAERVDDMIAYWCSSSESSVSRPSVGTWRVPYYSRVVSLFLRGKLSDEHILSRLNSWVDACEWNDGELEDLVAVLGQKTQAR